MATRKFLARDITLDVNTGSVATPVWTPVNGLTSLSHSPATERADATGFDSAGYAEHVVSQRGDSWAFEGHKRIDPADGTADPGQAAIEASARVIGFAAELQYRITIPGTSAPTYTFSATAEVSLPGGGTNDLAAWSGTLEVTGTTAVGTAV